MTTHPAPPDIRFGYHGSKLIATRIIEAAGYDPAVGFVLSEYDIADPFRMLRDGEQDVMIAKFALDEPDLACGPVLLSEDRAIVVRADHPLAGRGSVSIEDVADYACFERPGTMPAYVWDEVVPPTTPSGRVLKRVHQVETVPQMMALVATTDAVHVSLASLTDLAPSQIRIVPIHDLAPAPVVLAWRRDLAAEHVRAFLAATEKAAAR
ncbi:MAG: LysR family transcriptional regulator [Streptomycetaceae bacterium]|nr:LysR family transcriptional regulator [Streptomycetaceae bacterium]